MSFNFQNMRFLRSYGFETELPPAEKREVALCGRSNVGKSSLLNKLGGQKSLARVSSTPGKTTTINLFHLSQDTILADLPGYGYAKRSDAERKRWAGLMEHYFNSGRDIALVLQLLDMRHDPSQDDYTMLDFLSQLEIPFAVVLTKSDKLNKTDFAARQKAFEEILDEFSPLAIMPFSTMGQEPVERLREYLSCHLALK